jgi:uncharacterized protein (TIGR01777 family)
MPVFRFESVVDAPLAEVFAWHTRPGAMERLTPPWENIQVTDRSGGMSDGGTVTLRFRRGPIPLTWTVKHTAFEPDRMFRDEQVDGPFERWVHTHRFEAEGATRCRVMDEIEWEPPLGALGEAFGRPLVEGDLRRLFRFRHDRLAGDLERIRTSGMRPGLTIGITGASGLIGRSLTPALTTEGHTVVPFVRPGRSVDGSSIEWDPGTNRLDPTSLEPLDAVVHLAGEPIAGGRWTAEKKAAIRESRTRGTRLLAEALDRCAAPPETLVSGSAIGFYGDRGSESIGEDGGRGRGFLAEVCEEWEAAAAPAARAGVRVVHLRTGIVLTPDGGALGEMLPAFRAGGGGRIGTGRQYMSWIDLDDTVGAIQFALGHASLRGPVNLTAPGPVTNASFVNTLGRVLNRPTIVPLPSLAVRTLFGEMGKTLLLEGARVFPRKLQEAGFAFQFSTLEDSLRHQLGRQDP